MRSTKIPSLEFKYLITQLPRRNINAHKNDFGHVLVIGGDYGYGGAPVLAALGALRVGAGLVTLASHKDHLLGLNSNIPEIMASAIDDVAHITDLLAKASVVVIGPGLGRSSWSQQVFNAVISSTLPMVIDADALNLLAQKPQPSNSWVITPHPGEAARLLQQDHPIPIPERVKALEQLIRKFNCTVVLKGAGTLVGSPNTKIAVCTDGNPGMASGGMGDLLSGVIAGLIAQGMTLDNAAKLAVAVHALAGDLAAARGGHHGLLATDLLGIIRSLIG